MKSFLSKDDTYFFISPFGNLLINISGSDITITKPANDPRLNVSTTETIKAPKKINIKNIFSRL